MSIFNLSLDESKPAVVLDETNENVSPTHINGNKSTSDTVVTDDNVRVDKTGVNKESSEKGNIVLDGPLSSVYTKALNMALSNEGMAATIFVNNEDTAKKKILEEETEGVYVYCCNGDDLAKDDVGKIDKRLHLALDSKRFKNRIVAIECNNVITDQIGLLNNISTLSGATVCFDRKTALNAIRSSLSR